MLFTGTTEPVVSEIWELLTNLLKILTKLFILILKMRLSIQTEGKNQDLLTGRLVNRKLERFKEAIDDYSNELQYGPPQNVKAFNNRAYCFAKLDQYENAIKDYSNVIECDQKNIHALHNRGISFERLRKYKNVIELFIVRQLKTSLLLLILILTMQMLSSTEGVAMIALGNWIQPSLIIQLLLNQI